MHRRIQERLRNNTAIASNDVSDMVDFPIVSEVTNFPSANVGDRLKITSAGWLGGVAGVGVYVGIGDVLYCNTTTISGTYAQVNTKWGRIPAMGNELITKDSDLVTKVV